ncbi:MAG TPA: TonB family protein [Thermoanaerobaculia bacterium]|nr:TonB family protein [Thermoanaerobaculia bacterium]
MFETSVVQARTQAAAGRFSLLTISLIAHSAVIIGAVAVSIASVEFPTAAPDEMGHAPIFQQVSIPPPLGNPNGGARPVVAAQPERRQEPAPTQPTAPSIVPDTVPAIDAPLNATGDSSGDSSSSTGTVPGPIGVPWGVEGSPGDLDAPPAIVTTPPVQERIYESHEVKAPVIIRRVDPEYPNAFRPTRMKVMVVVRCVIDKNGQVRNAEILKPGPPAFNAQVLHAVQQWRFTPGSLNGIAVDTYLNLTVNFSVN